MFIIRKKHLLFIYKYVEGVFGGAYQMRIIKKNKPISLLILCIIFFLSFENSHASPILQDNWATIFDYKTGKYIQGHRKLPDTNIVRLAYQGGSHLKKDLKIGGQPIKRFPVKVGPHQKVTIENVGSLYGEEVVFAMEAKTGFYLDFDEGGLAVSSNEENSYQITDYFKFWIEDKNKNIINDDSTLFLLSTTSKRNANIQFYETIYMSNSSEVYIVASNQREDLSLSTLIYPNSSNVEVESNANYSEEDIPNNYSYGFQSLGKPIEVQRNMASIALTRITDIFLSPNNPVGVELPYQAPRVINTLSQNWGVAEVEVIQEVINQGFDNHYPQSLDIIIEPDSILDIEKIGAKDVSVSSSNGMEIENYKVSFPVTGINKNKLVVSLPSSTLKKLKDTNVVIKTKIPLKLEEPTLKDHLDNGVIKTVIKANNNKALTSSKLPIVATGNANVVVPKPTGEPRLGKIVYQNSFATELVATELVKNLKSEFPNDSVKINKVLDTKEFEVIGEDSVKVEIQSVLTGVKNEIEVPMMVISRGLNILEPIEIIPVKDQIAKQKEDLIYYPTIKQKISNVSNASETLMDDLKLVMVYSPYLNKEEMTFEIFVDGEPMASDKYVSKDEGDNTFSISFNNSTINEELLGKEVTIEHKAPIGVNDGSIMNIYQESSKEFAFPIMAYHTYKEKKETFIYTQKPKTEETQKINYQPKIEAEGIDKEEVIVGSEVKNPEEYIKTISELDFTFDSYNFFFKEKPDFSTVGEKEFIVIAESISFKHQIEIPVVVNVGVPKSELSIKQVYKGTNQSIYSEISPEIIVDNSNNKGRYPIGDPLEPILKSMTEDESQLQLNFNWYKQLTYKEYSVRVDDKVIETDRVPAEDFEVIYEYSGLLSLSVSDIDFDEVAVTSSNHFLHPLKTTDDNKNKDIEVVNTTLNPHWKIKVALPSGITNLNNDETYLGGLEFTRTNETTPVEIGNSGVVFAERWATNNDIKTIIPLSINLYQDIGNMVGEYHGEVVWSVEDAP